MGFESEIEGEAEIDVGTQCGGQGECKKTIRTRRVPDHPQLLARGIPVKQCRVSPGTPSASGRIGVEGLFEGRTLGQNPEASRQIKRLSGKLASVEQRLHGDGLSSEIAVRFFSP